MFGPRQRAGLEGAVVAAFVDQAVTKGCLTIHGDGTQTRDFIHVLDVVDALWLLGGPDTPVGAWNVAAGGARTVNALADEVERAFGAPLRRDHGPRRPGDVVHSSIAAGRLISAGWRPRVALATAIADLVETARRGLRARLTADADRSMDADPSTDFDIAARRIASWTFGGCSRCTRTRMAGRSAVRSPVYGPRARTIYRPVAIE